MYCKTLWLKYYWDITSSECWVLQICQFFLICTLFIDFKCSDFAFSALKGWRSLLSKVSACISESKWYFFNLAFPGWLFDEEKKCGNESEYAGESCLSYLNNSNCKSLIPIADVFVTLVKQNQDIKNVDNLYPCPDELNSTILSEFQIYLVSTFKKCFYHLIQLSIWTNKM